MYKIIVQTALLLLTLPAHSQTSKDIAALAAQPGHNKSFPVNYSILQPAATADQWDMDYNAFYKYVSPAIRKTQVGISYSDKGVHTWICTPSAMSHAQLDTTTIIRSKERLYGNWRKISHRIIRFTDSARIQERIIYRSDTVLDQEHSDDAFASFTEDHFKLYVKEASKKEFKKKIAARYTLESGRYLLLYKLFKTSAGISQIGIDKDGQLIIHYVSVIESKVPSQYITYNSIIEQVIFERIQ